MQSSLSPFWNNQNYNQTGDQFVQFPIQKFQIALLLINHSTEGPDEDCDTRKEKFTYSFYEECLMNNSVKYY